LARALARLIVDQPSEVLPELLFKGLRVNPEALDMFKADDFWGKSLQMHFQSPVFFVATASLSAALAQSPGDTLVIRFYHFWSIASLF
jgi:hypothetical protein